MSIYDQPLSEENREYLSMHHPRGEQIIREVDALFPQEEEQGDDETPPYEQWTMAELRTESKARKLPVTGEKEDLIARLNQNDAETSE